MHRAGLTWLLLVAAFFAITVLAEPASASRPFSHAVLRHQITSPGLHNWLIVKTVTGPDEPRRMSLRTGGVGARAEEIEGAHGRWKVSRRTDHGRPLIRALRADLDETETATLHAIGRYQCHATFSVSFRIRAYNEPAPAQFEDATGCEDVRRYHGSFAEQAAPVSVRIARQGGNWYFRRFNARRLQVSCSDTSSRTVTRAIRDRVKIAEDQAFRTEGRNGDVDDGKLIRIAGTVGPRHASGTFRYFREQPGGVVCETTMLHWDASR